MLEELIKLKKAMKENKSKGFVYERWQDYDNEYKKIGSKLGFLDKKDYREVFLEYIRYISKSSDK